MSEKRKPVKLDSDSSDNKLAGRYTIYIDTEDDITSIIEKVKESDSSVLALVPPKRVGVLQSVVSLKLLQKAAKSGRKKIAIITTDTALIALAAGLRIPVARNLTTQPELVEAPELDDTDSDIINGEEIAIGDLAKSVGRRDPKEDKEMSAAVKAIETDDKIKNDADADGVPDHQSRKQPKAKRVPNFDAFRKKLLIFGSLGLVLIIFLIWAIIFAPRGTITITADTTNKNISTPISLRPNVATNVDNKVVQPIIKQIKRTESVDFTATGTKEIGEKAKGKVAIYNKGATYQSVSLSAGTIMRTSSGLQFSLDSAITIGGSTVNASLEVVPGSASVSVTATNVGSEYNIEDNTSMSVAGYSSDRVYAVVDSDFTGGSKETVKVVQQSDIDSAIDKLEAKVEQKGIVEDLKKQMGEEVVILEESFTVNTGQVTSKPALNEEVKGDSGSATATMEITYTLVGISRNDLENLIEAQLGDLKDQKVYDNGIDKIQFKNFVDNKDSYVVTVNTTVQVGLDLDKHKDQIKERAVGKRSGEIVSEVEAITGVDSAKVQFWPFWVNRAPAENKLTVEFSVNE